MPELEFIYENQSRVWKGQTQMASFTVRLGASTGKKTARRADKPER